jgi:4'-phosphopantetheinyl transferase
VTQLTPKETAMLLDPALAPPDALRAFYRVWTAKEAYAKALGLGLGFDFARIECALGAGDAALELRVDGVVPAGWALRTLAAEIDGERYVAIAARAQDGSTEPCVVHAMDEGRVRHVEAHALIEEAMALLGAVPMSAAARDSE